MISVCSVPGCIEPPELASAAPGALLGQPMLDALDLPAFMNPTLLSLVAPDPDAAAVRSQFGIIAPTRGPTFLLLSTGRSNNDALTAEPGVDFPPAGVAGDAVTLRLQVDVPANINRLSFDYTFLSAEAPERLGASGGDEFTARVTDGLGANREIASVTTNNAAFYGTGAINVGPSPFLLYVDDPSGIDTVFNNGAQLDAGTTGYRRVDAAIAGGGPLILELDIRDGGDGLLDSAVLVDNLVFSAFEIVDPVPALLDGTGRITRNPAALVTLGQPVGAAAADGVTQLVVRSQVPGPGHAVFSLPSGAASDGALAAVDAPTWGTAVAVDAIVHGGKYYVYALYRTPPDFNRGGDAALASRAAPLQMQFTPNAGAPFGDTTSFTIVRPPVVIVPDLWSSCQSWAAPGGILSGPPSYPTLLTCADYQATAARGLIDNNRVVELALTSARNQMRAGGTAVTQADVIGHGMGGLLARRHIDSPSYLRSDNFLAGDIHRLITMNTPHLGSRMADEIVRFRDHVRTTNPSQWASVNATLLNAGICIDGSAGCRAVDDMRTDSPLINQIGLAGRQVPSHALYSRGGRNIARPASLAMLGHTGLRVLFAQMEQLHPAVAGRPAPERQRLIFGPESKIFCTTGQATDDDDHDLVFATTWEQRGGLPRELATQLVVSSGVLESSHLGVPMSAAHTAELSSLLHEPTGSLRFSPGLAPPVTVPRINSCPLGPVP